MVGLYNESTTNSHGVAALDFATVSGCDQLLVISWGGSDELEPNTADLRVDHHL